MIGGSLGVAVTGAIFQGAVGTANFADGQRRRTSSTRSATAMARLRRRRPRRRRLRGVDDPRRGVDRDRAADRLAAARGRRPRRRGAAGEPSAEPHRARRQPTRLEQVEAGQSRGREVERGSVSTVTRRAAIVSRFDSSTALGAPGQGVRTTAATSSPARPRRLDRQQGVVDRPQPGRGGDHQRQAEVDREVADQVAGRERHEQAADALADERRRRPPPPRAPPRSRRAGSISSPASSAARCGEAGGP